MLYTEAASRWYDAAWQSAPPFCGVCTQSWAKPAWWCNDCLIHLASVIHKSAEDVTVGGSLSRQRGPHCIPLHLLSDVRHVLVERAMLCKCFLINVTQPLHGRSANDIRRGCLQVPHANVSTATPAPRPQAIMCPRYNVAMRRRLEETQPTLPRFSPRIAQLEIIFQNEHRLQILQDCLLQRGDVRPSATY